MLLRPDIRAPRSLWIIALMLRLADGGIFMLLLPSQATENRIHPKNTWAGVGVDNIDARLVSMVFPRRVHTR